MASNETFHFPNTRKLLAYKSPTIRPLAAWVISLPLVFVFVGAGSAKLRGETSMIELFVSFGYPIWFMYFTGLLEVAGGLLLLLPRLSGIGTVMLIWVMLGALISKLGHGQADTAFVPLALLGLLLTLGSLRYWSPIGFLTARRAVTRKIL
jgi:putative oxidoreductase